MVALILVLFPRKFVFHGLGIHPSWRTYGWTSGAVSNIRSWSLEYTGIKSSSYLACKLFKTKGGRKREIQAIFGEALSPASLFFVCILFGLFFLKISPQ